MKSKFIDIDFFDLAPIYEIGRHHAQANGDVNIFLLDPKEEIKLKPFITSLRQFFLTKSSQKFKPYFIELSLYEPSDVNGKSFYSLLLSYSEDFFSKYESQMKENIKGRKGENLERGIIIPNPQLYKSTYFYQKLQDKVLVPKGKLGEMKIRFGNFKDPEETKPYQNHKELSNSVKQFFKNVISSFSITKPKLNSGIYVNTALLIPLYRPASTIDNTSVNMFKGGGIFIYGATDETFNHSEFVIELKTILLKSIFKQSFSQIEGEKLKERLTAVELNTFHHLRSSFQHLPRYVADINEAVGISSNVSIKASLSKVENYITSFLNNSLSLLSVFKNTISKTPKDNRYKISQLQDDLNDWFVEDEWVYLKSGNETNISNCIKIDTTAIAKPSLAKSLKAHPESLHGIIITYIQNVMQAFINQNGTLQGISISITIKEIALAEYSVLEFIIFNNSTQVPEDLLPNIGKDPNPSEHSSGLGMYFINTMLGLIGGTIYNQSEERFFSMKNIDYGVRFSFQILI